MSGSVACPGAGIGPIHRARAQMSSGVGVSGLSEASGGRYLGNKGVIMLHDAAES